MATTTPNYGWPVPTSTDFVKDGATAIEALGDAIDATVFGLPSGGLTLVKTQTIGTTVSSVTVTDAFSATYDSYIITISGGVASTISALRFELGASTTGYYAIWINNAYSGGATTVTTDNNGSRWSTVGRGSANLIQMTMNISNPFLEKYTYFTASGISATQSGFASGLHAVETSYTDFNILPALGTLTGGIIRIYGYQNS
jgi:hypothetical protein